MTIELVRMGFCLLCVAMLYAEIRKDNKDLR